MRITAVTFNSQFFLSEDTFCFRMKHQLIMLCGEIMTSYYVSLAWHVDTVCIFFISFKPKTVGTYSYREISCVAPPGLSDIRVHCSWTWFDLVRDPTRKWPRTRLHFRSPNPTFLAPRSPVFAPPFRLHTATPMWSLRV